MKGVILAGGTGSRLQPLTLVTNKHLLPVYNQPMIYYPLQRLLEAGINNILIISGPEHSGHFLRLLGGGQKFGCRLSYEIQVDPAGIAHALQLAEIFADGESMAVVLGDSIFEDNFYSPIQNFSSGAHIFLKSVSKPERFGVADLKGNKVVRIEEKPEKPKTNYAVTGFYIYDNRVFDIIRQLKPSRRNEFEITDVNNKYIEWGEMEASVLDDYWSDAGTIDSLHEASVYMKKRHQSINKKIRDEL